MKSNLLIVDDEEHTREGLELALEDKFEVFLASSAEEAFNAMEAEKFEVVLTDLRMSGESGMSVIDFAIRHAPDAICIMMTAYGEVDVAVEAMKRGAFDFLSKPVNLEKLDLLIMRGLNERKLKKENHDLHKRLDKTYSFDGILGKSQALEKVLEQVQLVGPSKATVLVTGETGTGKELIAQAIHQNSDRSRGPFVPVHCAALPSNLLESELFGHEKGAFTGASTSNKGIFRAADTGTLLLDEISEMPLSLQAKLLRVLQEKIVTPLGSQQEIPVDVRVIATTNRSMMEEIKQNKFREDLYYRLNVFPLLTKSLAERKDDIVPIATNLLTRHIKELSEIPYIELNAIKALLNYNWPGNVRELENVIQRALVLCSNKTISELDIIVDTDNSKASVQDNLRDQILSKASLEEGISNV